MEDLTSFFMRGFQKYERNWILMMAFWATCKIAQPIYPIWQHIFAPPWSALKKPLWEFNFFHIFGIPSSSRYEKHSQMLQTLFWLFQCSKNSRWDDYKVYRKFTKYNLKRIFRIPHKLIELEHFEGNLAHPWDLMFGMKIFHLGYRKLEIFISHHPKMYAGAYPCMF
jgi:hypothetical protein